MATTRCAIVIERRNIWRLVRQGLSLAIDSKNKNRDIYGTRYNRLKDVNNAEGVRDKTKAERERKTKRVREDVSNRDCVMEKRRGKSPYF